ncbi:class A beta-lactamase, subclass A2 [Porphyromonas macacae]
MKMKKRIFTITLVIFNCVISHAQIDRLKSEINRLIKDKNATVGVSIIANNRKDTIGINENLHYPMQSVFKLPIALTVLSEVDKGALRLEQEIRISSTDLLPDTWSPIRNKYPKGTTMPLSEVIRYTVSESDNNGCDILLQLIGGTTAVEEFLSKYELTDISIKASEKEMHETPDLQFRNRATPVSLTKLLTMFYGVGNKSILSQKSFDFLWKVMVDTSTGGNRLKGQLPKGTRVAHKTGTSGINERNIIAATHDIGIIILPTGDPVFISILVSNSAEDIKTNEKIISDIARKVWEYYTK